MAGKVIPVRIGDVELLVETTPSPGTEPTSKVGDAAAHVTDAFAHAQSAIIEIATSTVDVLRSAGERAARPDQMEVEFGLKFSAKGNVIVAGVAGEATLRVKLVYDGRAPALDA